jgi:homoserine O-acetyltransferase
VTVAFETWGRLDADRGNAVLVLHAITGDSHASANAAQGQPGAGWWEGMIGPGAPIDTDRYFVVCPNVLGGIARPRRNPLRLALPARDHP